MAEVKVVKGTLVPDAAAIRRVARAIQKEAETDPKILKALKKDPRGFLGDRGLPLDVQRELLQNAGLAGPSGECRITCITTMCCFTCWFTDIGH